MYLSITTKCNMTCAHCCFAATNRGDNMNREVFIEALMLAESLGELVTVGGGEPTVHPDFFEYLDKTIEFYEQGRIELPPAVITNGKLVSKARKLLQYVEEDRPLYVELSLDEYHDPIRPEIEEAFRRHDRQNKERYRYGNFGDSSRKAMAGVRTNTVIMPVGRAADPARGIIVDRTRTPCCCEDMLVDPMGDVYSCGCKHYRLGSVFDGPEAFQDFNRDLAHEGGGLPEKPRAPTPLRCAA